MSCTSAMPNPAANFEPFRRRLLGLAYRMLGSMTDAEDAGDIFTLALRPTATE